MKKKNRVKNKFARPVRKNKINIGKSLNTRFIVMLLVFVPLFFSGIFQGGYFPWEVYATLLLTLPAIATFLYFTIIRGENIKKTGAEKGILAFLIVAFLSLFFTVYFHATLTEFYKILIYFSAFYIMANVVRTRKDLHIVLNAALALGFILSILGLIAYAGVRFHLQNNFVNYLINSGFVQGLRLSSSVQYANTFAAFLIFEFFVAFSYLIYMKRLDLKITYGILSLLFIISLILTESRGGLIVFAIILILFVLLLRGKNRKEFFIYIGFLSILFAVFIILDKNLFFPILRSFGTRIGKLISFFKGKKSMSLGQRENMIKDSLKILKEHPVFGTGNGTYQYIYMKYRSVYFFSKFPHSIFFQTLDELGIVGGAAFLYMIYSLFRKGISILTKENDILLVGLFSGLSGILLHAFVDFDWSLMFMPLLFFMGFGVLLSMSKTGNLHIKILSTKKEYKNKKLRLKPGKNKSLAISSALLIILFILFIFPFSAARADFNAKRTEGKIPWQKTLKQYQTATSLDPLCAEYHYDLAHFYFTYLIPHSPNPDEFVNNAISQYKEAIKLCPEFFLYHFELARLYLQTGNKKAIDEFAKAVELNPIDPGGHAALGFAYLNLNNDTVMAKTQFEEALKLDSKNSDAHLGMGSLYEKIGKIDQAIEEYKLAIKYNRKSAYAYYRLGLLLEKEGNIPEAIRDLFYAVHYNPNLGDAKKEFEKYGTIVTVLKPSPGETLRPGKDYKIMWLSSKPEHVSYYRIWLIPKKGKPSLIKSDISGNATSYVWSIPNGLKTGNYKIRIYAMNPAVMDKNLGGWVSYGESEYFVIGRK